MSESEEAAFFEDIGSSEREVKLKRQKTISGGTAEATQSSQPESQQQIRRQIDEWM